MAPGAPGIVTELLIVLVLLIFNTDYSYEVCPSFKNKKKKKKKNVPKFKNSIHSCLHREKKKFKSIISGGKVGGIHISSHGRVRQELKRQAVVLLCRGSPAMEKVADFGS